MVNRPGIAAEQARLLARHSASAIAGNLAGSLVVVVLLWGVDARSALLAWLASMWVTMALRGRLLLRYRRADPGAADATAWGRRFARNALVAAALWGLAGFLFLPPGDEPYRQFGLSMALAGVAASGAGTIAAWPRAGIVYVVLALAPLALRFFTIGNFDYAIMGVIVLIYMGVMLQVARRNHQSVMATLALRIESTSP